jgi:hypothetical protein
MLIGLNFSHRVAESLGLDWVEALEALLIHLDPLLLRLSVYWDETATSPGVYDFSAIQALLDRVQRRDTRVLLTLGFKPQRHPAFFPPEWLASGPGDGSPEQGRLAANLLMMLERAVALLADYDVIDAWEPEHLPFLSAGRQPPGWSMSRNLVLRAVQTIREVDPRRRPVVVGHPGGRIFESGWRHALVAADVLGCTLELPPTSLNAAGWLRRWLPIWQLGLQAQLARRFGRGVWTTEFAAEEAGWWNENVAPTPIASMLGGLAATGAERAYLRGAEQWLLSRAEGQPKAWDSARRLFREARDHA